MQVSRYDIAVTADGSGNATGFTADPVVGTVLAIRYVADGGVPFANTVDFVFSGEISGIPILTVTNETASNTYYPRAATVTIANAASLYAAAGTAVNDRIPIAGERVKVTVAQAGAANKGTFYVWIG